MLVQYLGRAHIDFPRHPLVNQELTSEFTTWLNITSKVFNAGPPIPLQPAKSILDALYDNWTAFQTLRLQMLIVLLATGELP